MVSLLTLSVAAAFPKRLGMVLSVMFYSGPMPAGPVRQSNLFSPQLSGFLPEHLSLIQIPREECATLR
jgi:hypothetical protein